MTLRAEGLCIATSSSNGKNGVTNEGSCVGEENLHEVQDCEPAGRGARDLREPEAPPASGVGR